MKLLAKLIFILLFTFMGNIMYAQTEAELSQQINANRPIKDTILTSQWEQKTIFNHNEKDRGTYKTLSLKYGTIDKSNTLFVGGKAGWIISHKLAIGFGGYGFYGEKQELITDLFFNYTGGYGGFIVEPILFSSKVVHVTTPLLLGGGWVGKFQKVDNHIELMYDDLVFLVVEPGIELEFNITNKFRMSLGAYYIIANDIESTSELNDDIMKNLSIGLQFKWGIF